MFRYCINYTIWLLSPFREHLVQKKYSSRVDARPTSCTSELWAWLAPVQFDSSPPFLHGVGDKNRTFNILGHQYPVRAYQNDYEYIRFRILPKVQYNAVKQYVGYLNTDVIDPLGKQLSLNCVLRYAFIYITCPRNCARGNVTSRLRDTW